MFLEHGCSRLLRYNFKNSFWAKITDLHIVEENRLLAWDFLVPQKRESYGFSFLRFLIFSIFVILLVHFLSFFFVAEKLKANVS